MRFFVKLWLLIGTIFLTIVSILPVNNAFAHHSFSATFNSDKEITVRGIVTDFRFRNPHIIIRMDVTDADGGITNWAAEGSSATTWRRGGWQPDSIKPGDKLGIVGNTTKDGSPMVSIEQFGFLMNDGVTFEEILNESTAPSGTAVATLSDSNDGVIFMLPPKLPSGEPNFTGTTMQRGNLVEGIDGAPHDFDQKMPYNEVGQAANVSDVWSISNDPQVFCDPPGLVRQAGYTPYGAKISQYPDHITIEYEEYGSRRAIFFDDELPNPGVRSVLGDSVARYEGDSIVIQTVNLLSSLSGHRGKPLSEQARVTEVLTRIDDPEVGTILETKTTVVDPKFLTEPWTIKRYKLYSNNYQFIENECTPPLRERPESVFQYSEFDKQYLNRQ